MMIATGLCWTTAGVVSSNAAQKNLKAWDIFRISGILSLLIGAGAAYFSGIELNINDNSMVKQFYFLGLAGIASISGMLILQKAMRIGHNGILWALSQSAMVIPFFVGVLMFDEKVTLSTGIGITMIISSIIIFSIQREKSEEKNPGSRMWLLLGLITFIFFGATHTLSILPSYMKLNNLSIIMRAVFMQLGALSVLLTISAIKRSVPQKKSIKPALTLLTSGLLCQYVLFFRGLDILAKAGVGSIGFPIAVASCIIGFTFYSIFFIKEKTTRVQYLGLLCGLVGVVAISIR
ncbi:MAG: hypothetical protein ACYTFY_11360 [Planctomycetota bacterium]